ncbi:MAG TPA: hypothetical protein VKE95_02160 [Burkholderiales bacterium]|nr:hypothetical protein [Burkholderiales bacterium]
MKTAMRRISLGPVLCIAVLSLAGCAAAPRSDGGIVGTGNRIDCEALRKERPEAALPEDCQQESARK